jgi:hypothetical protein
MAGRQTGRKGFACFFSSVILRAGNPMAARKGLITEKGCGTI